MTNRIPDWQIAAEAADWATRIDAGPLRTDERASLAAWLKTSPDHVDELLFSASILAGLAQVDSGRALSIDELLADTAPEIIPLFHGSDTPVEPELSGGRRGGSRVAAIGEARPLARYWPAVAASLLVVLAVSWYGLSLRAPQEAGGIPAEAQFFATTAGDQQPIALEDGSILYMNTDSKARVAYSAAGRLVELLDGEALFDVAHDPERPFRVFAAGIVVEAVGTKFTVEHGERVVTVVVMGGEVLVGGRHDGSTSIDARLAKNTIAEFPTLRQPTRLAAGQSAQLRETGETRIAAANLSPSTAWQARQLSFRDEGLSVIAAEFNRFNTTKIVVADAELARTRFSGVFDSHDPESFIAFLELSAEVRVERPREGQVVLTAID
jgi:transmembrane sensor